MGHFSSSFLVFFRAFFHSNFSSVNLSYKGKEIFKWERKEASRFKKKKKDGREAEGNRGDGRG